MKRPYSTIILCTACLLFNTHLDAETLTFSKSVVDKYKYTTAWAKATITMKTGRKHRALIRLQKDSLLKNLKAGNLIYVKKFHEVFEVTQSHTDVLGNTVVTIQSAHLITKPKTKRRKKKR